MSGAEGAIIGPERSCNGGALGCIEVQNLSGSTVAAAAAPASAARRERLAATPVPDCSTASSAQAEGAHLLCPAAGRRTGWRTLRGRRGPTTDEASRRSRRHAQRRLRDKHSSSPTRITTASHALARHRGSRCIGTLRMYLVSCRLGAVRLMSFATTCGEADALLWLVLSCDCCFWTKDGVRSALQIPRVCAQGDHLRSS